MQTLRHRIYKMLHQPPLTPFERAKRAPRQFILDYTFAMSIYFAAIGAMIAKLTSYYGLSVSLSTIIATLPALLTALEFLSNRFFKHLRPLAIIWRLALPAVVASVLLPHDMGRVFMVISFFIMCLAFHIYQPSYNAWTVNVTQGHIPSNYFAIRDLFFLPTSTIVGFVFAAIISRAENSGNIRTGFLILAVLELLFVLPSLWIILRGLPHPSAPTISRTGRVQLLADDTRDLSILQEFKLVLADQNYQKVLLFHLVWQFFFQFCGFLAVFQIQVLQQDYLTLTIYLTISNVIRVALVPVFSWVGVKYGWKPVIFITLAMMAVGASCWIFINPSNLWLLFPIGTLLQSLPWAGLGIGMFYFQIACTKTETRSIYFSAHAGLSGIVAAIGVLCCNALVSFLSSMEHPIYWPVFALWIFGIVATFILVAWTPFPANTPELDETDESTQDAVLAQELAEERKAAAISAES